MIIVRIIGGLGNQMFQYAIARKLSVIQNSDFKIDISGFKDYKLHEFGLYNFQIGSHYTLDFQPEFQKDNSINIFERFIRRKKNSYLKVYEKSFEFEKRIFKKRGNIYLDGYWQTEKYFKDIRSLLIADFTPIKPPSNDNLALLELIKSYNSVSIHIRRGDYVTNKETQLIHGTSSLDYYRRAIEYINQKVIMPYFFVFSDDMHWVKENLVMTSNCTYVDINDASNNYEDLRLMQHCNHNIIANSSFSWWGAWLNQNPNKIVIAPQKWFNDASINTKDIIPNEWIRI